MTRENILNALLECSTYFRYAGNSPRVISDKEKHQLVSPKQIADHAYWMTIEASSWGDERREKQMRWLGFIQGVLVAQNMCTIAEVKEMNIFLHIVDK